MFQIYSLRCFENRVIDGKSLMIYLRHIIKRIRINYAVDPIGTNLLNTK